MTEHNLQMLIFVLTVIYTTAALLSFVISYRHVSTGAQISNKEKSLDAYLNFSDKYAEISRLSHLLETRFHQKDLSLSEYDIKYFYNSFWVLQLQEWEFYQAGIMPVRIFTQWMLHAHEYLLSEKAKGYFDERGVIQMASAKEGFEKYGRRVLRFHPDFIEFINELEKINYDKSANVKETYAKIESLVKTYKHDDTYWKL